MQVSLQARQVEEMRNEPRVRYRAGARESTCEKWCRRRESNPRPRDYEALALPLSYAGEKAILHATEDEPEGQAERKCRERCGENYWSYSSGKGATVQNGTENEK